MARGLGRGSKSGDSVVNSVQRAVLASDPVLEADALWTVLMDDTSDLVLVLDEGLRIVHASHACADLLFGLNRHELLGMPISVWDVERTLPSAPCGGSVAVRRDPAPG